MEIIGATLGNNIDHAAGPSTEFGSRIAADNLKFLNRFLAHRVSKAGPLPTSLTAKEWLGEFKSVQIDAAVNPSCTGNTQLVSFDFLHDPGGKQC